MLQVCPKFETENAKVDPVRKQWIRLTLVYATVRVLLSSSIKTDRLSAPIKVD